MYPSSSSSHGSMSLSGSGLIRYGSAPSTLLRTAVDSLIGPNPDYSNFRSMNTALVGPTPPYLTSETSSFTSESTCKSSNENRSSANLKELGGLGLQKSYGMNEMTVGEFGVVGNLKIGVGSPSSTLVRHSSSPAGFLNQLATAAGADNGFTVTRGIGSYNPKMVADGSCGISRLNSQLSFTRQDSLSHIYEESEDVMDGITNNSHLKDAHSYESASFGMGSWDNTNSIMFSASPNKRAKNSSSVGGLNARESQFQFSLPQTTLEINSMERLLNIPEDAVPCKIRAKRGCATHPRSIAERERRTRISGRLKKLQELVPNMDKQSSYADMLDLAVQHIKGLQNQVERLHKELENCTCGCKQNTT
uniref:Transcription factor bHLH11 n=1 Tax=Nothapodytes nimmoniana TaxID=159386 RepID=A0A9E9C3Z0_NOTNI|nr:transcription factor bHLH11 [Nothapodytes nimmoniana]